MYINSGSFRKRPSILYASAQGRPFYSPLFKKGRKKSACISEHSQPGPRLDVTDTLHLHQHRASPCGEYEQLPLMASDRCRECSPCQENVHRIKQPVVPLPSVVVSQKQWPEWMIMTNIGLCEFA